MADTVPSHLRSLNTDVQTYVRFINRSERRVLLFWLDYKGALVRYGDVPPNKAVSMYTYVTHPWIARDATNKYPLMFNGKQIFYPEAERNGQIFNPQNMEKVNIHIPVFPLFRRCVEVVYKYFESDLISGANIPKEVKDILLKITPITEFYDYKHFGTMLYEDADQEHDNEENFDIDDGDDGGHDNDNNDSD